MRKKFKVFISMAISAILAFSPFIFVDAAFNEYAFEVNIGEYTPERTIEEWFDCINEKQYYSWADMYISQEKAAKAKYVDNNIGKTVKSGIMSVDTITVKSINEAFNVAIPSLYAWAINLDLQDRNVIRCYQVTIDITSSGTDSYFSQGESTHVVILVNENNAWKIGEMFSAPQINNVPANSVVQSVAATYSIGYGFINLTEEPSTINVMDELGNIHYNENFSTFLVNATYHEIGEMGYCASAIKANIMAVKMCGWWCKAGSYREVEGCDLKFGDVAYMSTMPSGSNLNVQTLTQYVNILKGVCFISSSNGLFFTSYYAGSAGTGGYHSGRLQQNGSQYLGNILNYSWQEIMHYYYDNSSYNNPSVGIAKIICTTTHAPATNYESNAYTHWHTCANCGEKCGESSHRWVSYGTKYRCSICFKISSFIPATPSTFERSCFS